MSNLIQEAKLMQLKAGLITEDEYREAVNNLSEEVKPKTTKAADLQFILRDLGDAYGQGIADDQIKDDFKNYTVGQIKDDWINLKKGVRETVNTPPAATGKVQGTINPALFKGLGIEDFEPNKFSGIVQKIKNNQGLTAFENKVLANVFVAMIKTKDDAMLSKIFNNLKSVEAK